MAGIVRVAVKSSLLHWACDRSGREESYFVKRFPKFPFWLDGSIRPTYNQLQQFAAASHAPVGMLFLEEPPIESVPIPDFRTIAGTPPSRPGVNLLETIHLCQQRQDWYRSYLQETHRPQLTYIGSLELSTPVAIAAERISNILGWTVSSRRSAPTWMAALSEGIKKADSAGISVMVNGIVGNNTSRILSPKEFRGFALADDLAPIVFINGADTKGAQMFTLVHELAHLWLGRSGLSDSEAMEVPANAIEDWCNRVAAEILVPLSDINIELRRGNPISDEMRRLSVYFKVSTLVILRRMREVITMSNDHYWDLYRAEEKRLRDIQSEQRDRDGGGGNFYPTETLRVGRSLARALIGSTLGGQTLYRDAFHLLAISKVKTLHALAQHLENA